MFGANKVLSADGTLGSGGADALESATSGFMFGAGAFTADVDFVLRVWGTDGLGEASVDAR